MEVVLFHPMFLLGLVMVGGLSYMACMERLTDE